MNIFAIAGNSNLIKDRMRNLKQVYKIKGQLEFFRADNFSEPYDSQPIITQHVGHFTNVVTNAINSRPKNEKIRVKVDIILPNIFPDDH